MLFCIHQKVSFNLKLQRELDFSHTKIQSVIDSVSSTVWKVSKNGVISGPYFPIREKISVFSPNTGKYGPEISPYLDTFHAVQRVGYDKILFRI